MPVTSRPSSRTSPRVGRSWPRMQLNSVDLPEPLGPMMPRISPSRTSKETPSHGVRCRRSACATSRTSRTVLIAPSLRASARPLPVGDAARSRSARKRSTRPTMPVGQKTISTMTRTRVDDQVVALARSAAIPAAAPRRRRRGTGRRRSRRRRRPPSAGRSSERRERERRRVDELDQRRVERAGRRRRGRADGEGQQRVARAYRRRGDRRASGSRAAP